MPKQKPVLNAAPNNYFVGEKKGLRFVSTGCTLLDCTLGGGFVLGRVANIVGDKSTSKTALACEAVTNFLLRYPGGTAAYRETEAAFDRDYAAAMGMPVKKVDWGQPLITVEGFARDFDGFLDQQIEAKQPGIYVLDSLDALSDEAEMERKIGEGSYGTAKAKQLSEFFRKNAQRQEQAQVLLLVISQVRDAIGVLYGDKQTRSGGRALNFYASQIMWLAHTGILKKTINKVERPYGVSITAKIKKNKVGLPFRDCAFEFLFAYGVEDVRASIDWLEEVGRLGDFDLTKEAAKTYRKELEGLNHAEYKKEQGLVADVVKKVWREVETSFLPRRSKYAD